MGLWSRYYGRIFAAGFDRFMAASERAGMADIRRDALSRAKGRTVEIGAGTGLNLANYPAHLAELILTEPEGPMVGRLRNKVETQGLHAEVVQAGAEKLPFEDDSVDTVTATLVLCTVPDPTRALAEITRVLTPGGQLLFLEHVRSGDPKLAKWQDRLHWPWLKFGNGCHCNRATLATIEASGLEVREVEHGETPKGVPIVRPLVWGSAIRPGHQAPA